MNVNLFQSNKSPFSANHFYFVDMIQVKSQWIVRWLMGKVVLRRYSTQKNHIRTSEKIAILFYHTTYYTLHETVIHSQGRHPSFICIMGTKIHILTFINSYLKFYTYFTTILLLCLSACKHPTWDLTIPVGFKSKKKKSVNLSRKLAKNGNHAWTVCQCAVKICKPFSLRWLHSSTGWHCDNGKRKNGKKEWRISMRSHPRQRPTATLNNNAEV